MVAVLRPYGFTRRWAEPLGTMGTMQKGPPVVVCALATHPQGWEPTVAMYG